MASTGIPGIQCAHCGWLNEPGARMCGGCGRPLTANMTNAANDEGRRPSPTRRSPILRLQTVAAPRGRATPLAPPPIPTRRRMSPVARVFLILGVVILITRLCLRWRVGPRDPPIAAQPGG